VEEALLETYLNSDDIWAALEVPKQVKNFSLESSEISRAFSQTVDLTISTQAQVQYLLSQGIDILMYQGVLDLACNTAGNLRWANSMPWKGLPEFASKKLIPWTFDKKIVGSFKEVYIQTNDLHSQKTRFSFVTVEGAGHLVCFLIYWESLITLTTRQVPYDNPNVALDIMTRWIRRALF
jgi:cathepsin A (carboxypeptidase C)